MDTVIDTVRQAVPESIITTSVTIVSLLLLCFISWKLLRILQLFRGTYVWLEVTPPANMSSSIQSSTQLFNVIHGIQYSQSFSDKLLRKQIISSFEITSTKQAGIRYYIRVQSSLSRVLQKQIHAYMQQSKVKVIDYVVPTSRSVKEFKQSGNFLYPLAQLSDSDVDPLNYVTAAMTKLDDNQTITIQIISQPIKLKNAKRFADTLFQNENAALRSSTFSSVVSKSGQSLATLANGLTSTISEMVSGSLYGHRSAIMQTKQDVLSKNKHFSTDKPNRSISTFEQELLHPMTQKIQQPLFQVNLRVLSNGDVSSSIRTIKSALSGYSNPLYQSIRAKQSFSILSSLRKYQANHRLPSFTKKQAMILSASELAGLFHFTNSRTGRVDTLQTSLSRTLPAPVSLKQSTKPDIIFGMNHHQEVSTPIGLTEKERERHMYIIGGTGNGKTTMLQYQIIQDIQKGNGVAVIDPHGDMAEFILDHIPEERINDVIYVNPSDFDHPIGLNLLEIDSTLSGNELLHEKDLVTESVISVFRKIFSEEDNGGHRIEYVLRNAIQTALTVEGATLFTVFELLNDPVVRKKVTHTLEDIHLRNFWKHELAKAGEMQRVKMGAGITSKIGRFLFSASARQILGQSKSTIDFEDILNSKKILICNLSKGNIGEDTSELFGITILAKIQLASLKRAKLPTDQRVPFYLYVDEFQNFATQSFVQMLSESRKYKLALIMAEQSTSQQDDQQMVNIILANVGTVIAFKTGNPQDEKVLYPLFTPYIDQSEISNLASFNFYAKLSAIRSQEPVSGITLLIDAAENKSISRRIIQHSRSTYGSNSPIISTLGALKDKKITDKPARLEKSQMLDG